MKTKAAVFLGIILLFSGGAAALPNGLVFNGYAKAFLMVYHFTERTAEWFHLDTANMASVNNRLRLKFTVSPWDRLRFDAAYEILVTVQDRELYTLNPLGFTLRAGDYRVTDFRSKLYPKDGDTQGSLGFFHNLDRFAIIWKLPSADITIGRQVIAWGSARIINSTDILIPFSFKELDKEERTGVDAIRVRIPLGAMSEIDAGFLPGPDFRLREGAAYFRSRFALWNSDISLLLMNFRQHLLVGLDLARSLGGASLWLECGYVAAGAFKREKEATDKNYFRASVGADHQLGAKTYAFVEYHFNGAGKRRGLDYADNLGTAAYEEGATYLLGRHYLGAGLTYQTMPLLPVTGLLLWNMSDGSLMALVEGEYNIAENIYLAGGAHIGLGRGPEVPVGIPHLPGLGIRSEFGLYPHLCFASFRVYF